MDLILFGCPTSFYNRRPFIIAIARRFSGGNRKRMRVMMISVTAAGYLCSFGGFKKLISFMYPVLGYMGMVLRLIKETDP